MLVALPLLAEEEELETEREEDAEAAYGVLMCRRFKRFLIWTALTLARVTRALDVTRRGGIAQP